MFNDTRSKKVVFVCHCILNQNSISDGTADYSGTIDEVTKRLLKEKIGIVQMPCPELMCLGLDRGDIKGAERSVVFENTRIRNELLKNDSKKNINIFVENTIYQIEEYLKYGFKILGIIGINRSPSCGVDTTSKNNEEVEGQGVFINSICTKLNNKNIKLPVIGIKTTQIDKAIKSINKILS